MSIITNMPDLLRKYLGGHLSERELSDLWADCFDEDVSIIYGTPLINTFLFEEWCEERFVLPEEGTLFERLSTIIGKDNAVCFQRDFLLLWDFHEQAFRERASQAQALQASQKPQTALFS
jgi:hypothetical protein